MPERAYIVTRPSLMLHPTAGKCMIQTTAHSGNCWAFDCRLHGSCLPWGLLTTGRGSVALLSSDRSSVWFVVL